MNTVVFTGKKNGVTSLRRKSASVYQTDSKSDGHLGSTIKAGRSTYRFNETGTLISHSVKYGGKTHHFSPKGTSMSAIKQY